MRDLAKGERLLERLGGRWPDTLELLQLDVTDPRSLAAAAQQLQGQRLDVLGMAVLGAPSVPGLAEGISLGSQPCPGHREQVPNHGRYRHSLGWDRMCLAGQRCSRWIWGCQGPINRGRPPHFSLLALGGVRGFTHWLTAPCLAVCNAGVGLMGPLETCSDHAMKTLFDVNLFGAVRTIQAFLPAMKSRRAGRIIVSSSIGGLQGGTPSTLWHREPRGRALVLRVQLCPRAALQCCVLRQQVCGGGTVRESGHRPAPLQHPVSAGDATRAGSCPPGWGECQGGGAVAVHVLPPAA